MHVMPQFFFTLPYRLRLNWQAERWYVDTFKGTLNKARIELGSAQFLRVKKIRFNLNASSGMSLVELKFSWKLKSNFEILLQEKKKCIKGRYVKSDKTFLSVENKVHFQIYKNSKDH